MRLTDFNQLPGIGAAQPANNNHGVRCLGQFPGFLLSDLCGITNSIYSDSIIISIFNLCKHFLKFGGLMGGLGQNANGLRRVQVQNIPFVPYHISLIPAPAQDGLHLGMVRVTDDKYRASRLFRFLRQVMDFFHKGTGGIH